MVQIGKKVIGDGQPCFITFEAGATHDGVEAAKRLASLAAMAGGDAVKFQILDPDRLVADKKQLFTYEVMADRKTGRTVQKSEPLYDILRRRTLSHQEWRQVKSHCDSLGLAFFATVSFADEITLLAELGCDSIKIASADVNHWPLIREAAGTGMCVQLDTGHATIGEVEAAVDVVRSQGNEKIIIHNCPSGYPARLASINLRLIPTLKRIFSYPVAFSDHTPGWHMDVAAVALGANMVEKTITEDRSTASVEHLFSLEPHEMHAFVETIREVEIGLGSCRRILHPEERARRKMIRRSIYLRNPVRQGQPLTEQEVDFRRPGLGITPDRFDSLAGLRFRRDLPAGHLLTLADLE
ncbi:MAG: N-acetylneuraminate synthase family protein [Thermodesulfobacteriota bacterium]